MTIPHDNRTEYGGQNVDPARLPDFILGGAMKSGTRSLHRFLASRPDVFIPDRELFFFAIDDWYQHPDLHFEPRHVPDFDANRGEYARWYESHFADASDDQLIGEDSTTYLASAKAPERIKALLPDVRLLFLLRDPVERCYSHYWHLVRTRRTGRPFDEAISEESTLVQRSCYAPQLRRYMDVFPDGQLGVFVFEELLEATTSVLRRICGFLGLDGVEDGDLRLPHEGAGGGFRSVRAALLYNEATKNLRRSMYRGGIPGVEGEPGPRWLLKLDGLVARFNRVERDYPSMDPGTGEFLRRLLRRENRGLGNLLGINLSRYWQWW